MVLLVVLHQEGKIIVLIIAGKAQYFPDKTNPKTFLQLFHHFLLSPRLSLIVFEFPNLSRFSKKVASLKI